MTIEQLAELCNKRELELLKKYFGNAVKEAVITKPERIGMYTKDLPLKVAAEYKQFLEDLWNEHAPEEVRGTPLFLDKHNQQKIKTCNNNELMNLAYDDAIERTLWERITKTNYIDVAFYKGLLEKYTCELLMMMRKDFLEEIQG